MADIVDKATRSKMMSGIRGKNTKPELLLRRALHRLGLRFRLHSSGLPGRPDIVLPKHNAVVQVQGCFWHRHYGCPFATSPSTNAVFWSGKFEETVRRDERNLSALKKLGWRVAVVWECSVKKDDMERTASRVKEWAESGRPFLEIPKLRRAAKLDLSNRTVSKEAQTRPPSSIGKKST